LLSGLFSALETAFTSLNIIHIREIAKKNPKRARTIEKMYLDSETLITTLLIGNNLVNTSISVVTTNFVIEVFGDQTLGIATGVITLLLLVFGEVTPKQIAIIYNRFLIEHTAPLLQFLRLIFWPFTFLLNATARLIKLLTHSKANKTLTEEGLLHMIDHAEDLGILDDARTRMMRSVFRFSGVSAHSIMTHRTKVFSLQQDVKVGEAMESVMKAGFSRIPIYDKNPENISGIVLEKEITRFHQQGKTATSLKELMIPPVFVPESWKIEKVFALLKTSRIHLAVVLDEYGGLAGIITINDLIEEIMGEVQVEGSLAAPEQDRILKLSKARTWQVDGDVLLYQLAETLDIEFDVANDNLTLAGYLEELFGKIPEPGESIETKTALFVVEESTRTRILRARITLAEKIDPEESDLDWDDH